MTLQAIKNTAFAGAGGFAVGTATAIGILCTMTVKTAGPSLLLLPGTGLLFAGTAVVSRVADEVFKKFGWTDYPKTRLLTAHLIVGAGLTIAAAFTMGPPIGLGLTIAAVITAASLGVNLLINDFIEE